VSRPQSRNNRRYARKQIKKIPSLNLVALMDIFTILVFFLLVNSSNVQPPSSPELRLPEAKVEKPIEPSLMIELTNNDIVVLGRKVADAAAFLAPESDDLIPGLVEELRYQASRSAAQRTAGQPLQATLMADREIPFLLLKKIMLSAAEADYQQIAFAVIGQAQDAN